MERRDLFSKIFLLFENFSAYHLFLCIWNVKKFERSRVYISR